MTKTQRKCLRIKYHARALCLAAFLCVVGTPEAEHIARAIEDIDLEVSRMPDKPLRN